jgi:hypothetical protein
VKKRGLAIPKSDQCKAMTDNTVSRAENPCVLGSIPRLATTLKPVLAQRLTGFLLARKRGFSVRIKVRNSATWICASLGIVSTTYGKAGCFFTLQSFRPITA